MKLRILISLLGLTLTALAQSQINGINEVRDTSPLLDKTPVSLSTAARPDVPARSLGLRASEAIRDVTVPVQNDEEQELRIFGAQTTSGLYVVDVPKVIPPHERADVSLLYVAQPNTSSQADVVRLMTNRGEKIIRLEHGREQVAQLDTTTLQWKVGDRPATKSVIITLASDLTVPKGARALGTGNTAAIESLGDNRYRVDVTPASTDKPQQFPVMLQFVPALPGLPGAIYCSVVAAE
jgi:hypothetical protein